MRERVKRIERAERQKDGNKETKAKTVTEGKKKGKNNAKKALSHASAVR